MALATPPGGLAPGAQFAPSADEARVHLDFSANLMRAVDATLSETSGARRPCVVGILSILAQQGR